jgi:signal peptidase II
VPSRSPSRPLLVILAVAAVVVLVDQVTKTWALHHTVGGRHVVGTLWLQLTFNSGAAFGIGRGVTPVVEVVVVVLVAVLLAAGRRASRRASVPEAVAIGLLVGGALGNLADRVFRHLPGHPGAVIDFINAVQVGNHEYWPVFNVADSCIVVGAALLALLLSRQPRRRAPARSPSDA